VLDSLRLYFGRKGIQASCFASAEAFLQIAQPDEQFDCIVADVRMPGLSGLDLLRHLNAGHSTLPVILITGHGDVGMAVTAIKLGAFDFIEKPFDENHLLEVTQHALEHNRAQRDNAAEIADLRTRLETLTERQRQVMELAITGLSNKEIAIRLGISPRTVEIHRAWMMERMGARNLADLVRISMRLQPTP
jgi:two-component system, LuxR family, response regulator FixJ